MKEARCFGDLTTAVRQGRNLVFPIMRTLFLLPLASLIASYAQYCLSDGRASDPKEEYVRELLKGTTKLILQLRTMDWPPNHYPTRCWTSQKKQDMPPGYRHDLKYEEGITRGDALPTWTQETWDAYWYVGKKNGLPAVVLNAYDTQQQQLQDTYQIHRATNTCFVLVKIEGDRDPAMISSSRDPFCCLWRQEDSSEHQYEDCLKAFNETCKYPTSDIYYYGEACRKQKQAQHTRLGNLYYRFLSIQ